MLNEISVRTFREAMKKATEVIQSSEGSVSGDETEKLVPTTHSFSKGLYIREMKIPKGVIVMGKIHKYDHPNFLMKGEIMIICPEGEMLLKAPMHFISSAGTQRMGLALEDTVWVTVHENTEDLRDVKRLEDLFTVKTFEEYDKFKLLECDTRKELVNT